MSWSPDGTLPDVQHRRSAPSRATSFASICCRARRSSARISSAICSGTSSRRRRRPTGRPAAARHSARRACRRRRPAPARPARGDRLRRDPPPRERRCRWASMSSARQISPDGKSLLLTASAAGQQNLLCLSDRRAVEGAGGRAAADVDAGRRSAARSSRPTARRSTTSIAAACST